MKAVGIGLVVLGIAGVAYEGYQMYTSASNNAKATAAGLGTTGLTFTSYAIAGLSAAAVIAGIVIIHKHKGK